MTQLGYLSLLPYENIRDRVGRLGLSSLQKTMVVFWILAYGVPTNATDECIKKGESTMLESLKRFYRIVVEVLTKHYLRLPSSNDVASLLHISKCRRF